MNEAKLMRTLRGEIITIVPGFWYKSARTVEPAAIILTANDIQSNETLQNANLPTWNETKSINELAALLQIVSGFSPERENSLNLHVAFGALSPEHHYSSVTWNAAPNEKYRESSIQHIDSILAKLAIFGLNRTDHYATYPNSWDTRTCKCCKFTYVYFRQGYVPSYKYRCPSCYSKRCLNTKTYPVICVFTESPEIRAQKYALEES